MMTVSLYSKSLLFKSISYVQESLKFNEVKKKNEKERKILFPSIRCNEELHLTKKS